MRIEHKQNNNKNILLNIIIDIITINGYRKLSKD